MFMNINNHIAYPSNVLHRSTYYKSLFDSASLPLLKEGKACYNVSKGTALYKPHSATGRIGTTSASYRAQRKRI